MSLTIDSRNKQPKQLSLFEAEYHSPSSRNGDSSFNDPAFASNKTQPIHRWIPWIAGFSSDFVKDALDKYMNQAGVVLDPFCGVGTTLIEAVLQGHNAIGFEVNPYAALAACAKVNAHRVYPQRLHAEILRFQTFFGDKAPSDYEPHCTPPEGFKTRGEFYSPAVLRKVLIVQDFTETVKEPLILDLFRLAFAATMIRYSNYSYEPSLGRRASAGKEEIKDFPVARAMLDKLEEMAADIRWIRAHLPSTQTEAQIINDSFFQQQNYLKAESIDLIVTSPPYLNNYHYNRNTRPQMYWLGFAKHPQDLKALENSNFGKYWQTVRQQERLDLNFYLPDTDIADRLQKLRTLNREKGVYGGNGWANYAASYFNDCRRFAEGIRYSLKRGGTALLVIGNSILQVVMLHTDQYFGKIAESVGLELVRIDIPRATRVGNSIIQSEVRVAKAHDSHQLYEAVVEIKKP